MAPSRCHTDTMLVVALAASQRSHNLSVACYFPHNCLGHGIKVHCKGEKKIFLVEEVFWNFHDMKSKGEVHLFLKVSLFFIKDRNLRHVTLTGHVWVFLEDTGKKTANWLFSVFLSGSLLLSSVHLI